MSVLVEYAAKDSFFHKLNPITKILWTFTVFILSFVFQSPVLLSVLFLSNLAVAAGGKILKQVLPAVRALFMFSLLLILFQIFFVQDGTTLFYAVPFLKIGRVTDTGLTMSLVMSLRMLATTSTIPILMMTTQMTDMVVAMVEKCSIPFQYAFMFTTALRFIPTFMDEMEQILQAQISRGYHADTRNPFKKMVIIIPLAIPLLISSVKKAEKIAISMEARGFGSGPRSHYREIRMKSSDLLMLFIFGTLIVFSAAVSRLLPL